MARMIDSYNDVGPYTQSIPAQTVTAPAPSPAPTTTVKSVATPTTTNTATQANPFVTSQTAVPAASAPVPQPQMPPPPPGTPANPMVTGGNGQVQSGLEFGTGTPVPKPTYTPSAGVITGQPATPVYQPGMAPNEIVQGYLNDLLSSGSPYMENARLRGIETAQGRGLRNSSIAAGASQRAAIEAAQPFVSEMTGIQQNREQRAFQGEQAGLERQFTASQNQLDRDQQVRMSEVQNWLNDQQFRREFNGQLSLIPIQSAAALNQLIQQYALENPQVYTPDIISGMTNFFNTNFFNTLKKFWPGTYGG